MSDNAADTLCVVLAPHPQSLPEALRAELSRRRWREIALGDELLAMAELALHERVHASRSAWGLERSASLALVVVDTHRWLHLESLLDAVGTYVPGVGVWEFADDSLIRLRPVSEAAVASGANNHRSGRVEREDERGPDSLPRPAAITHEELDMLLNGGKEDQ